MEPVIVTRCTILATGEETYELTTTDAIPFYWVTRKGNELTYVKAPSVFIRGTVAGPFQLYSQAKYWVKTNWVDLPREVLDG